MIKWGFRHKSLKQETSTLDLAVCILFYEKIEQTIACIKSFLSTPVRIYVWNNGSSESLQQELRRFCQCYPQVIIFDSKENLGISCARNELIIRTKEKWLLFVDNDITIRTSNWLKRLSGYIQRHDDIEVFIPRLFLFPEGKYAGFNSLQIIGQKIAGKAAEDDRVNYFPGGASVINRGLFQRLGVYDGQMFSGLEDYELCIRAIVNGAPVRAMLIHDIVMIHQHLSPENEVDKKALLVRYDIKHIEKSYNRIVEKYQLAEDWEMIKQWVTHQLESRLGGKNVKVKKHWLMFIAQPIGQFIHLRVRTVKVFSKRLSAKFVADFE